MAKREKPKSNSPVMNGQERIDGANDEAQQFRVEDRRHWAGESDEAEEDPSSVEVRQPTMIDEFRQRAEAAEQQLQDYIDAFKGFKQEQEEFRLRLNRDVDRRVELKFGELASELLDSLDDLDLALEHSNRVPEAEPLAQGVEMVRSRFLATLQRHGVTRNLSGRRRVRSQRGRGGPNRCRGFAEDGWQSHGDVATRIPVGGSRDPGRPGRRGSPRQILTSDPPFRPGQKPGLLTGARAGASASTGRGRPGHPRRC